MHNSRPIERLVRLAMRAPRFRPALALAVIAALGGCAAHPGDGGLAVGRTQAGILAREDAQLDAMLTEMIASAEIGPDGRVLFNRPLGDKRFLEPNSGRYWQISGEGQEGFRSRSLWDRTLEVSSRMARTESLYYSSDQFLDEPLRIGQRTVRLPGSEVEWQFVVATPLDWFDRRAPSG
jgi:hypothetical protein